MLIFLLVIGHLGQFDVHKNTIIRTGESQAIGGKYLQGLELDTMEECQRLCCESEGCDVYIFEEKNDGYCYLFECGPPENFHCKFTRHANYTSAVLTHATRHVAETTTQHPATQPHLPTTSSISQQERELTNLKVKPDARSDKLDVTTNTAQGGNMGLIGLANGMLGIPQVSQPDVNSTQKASNASAVCGRFQFRCHSGECIAIYNACDGIPQCEDGSDEGPECSGASNTPVTSNAAGVATKSNADMNNNVDAVAMQKQQAPVVMQYQQQQRTQQQQQQQQQVAQQQMAQLQHQPQLLALPPPINNREDSAAWANRKIVVAQQQNEVGNGNADLNSRIFNHKGGIQVPTNGAATYSNNNNLSPLYAAGTLQHSGIYMPQAQDMQTSFVLGGGAGGGRVGETEQILQQQGHIIVPSGVNWPQQTIPSTFPAAGGGLQMQNTNFGINPAAAAAVQPQLIQQQPNQLMLQHANNNNNNMVIGSDQQIQLQQQQQLQQPQHFMSPSVDASAVVGLPNASDMTQQQTSSANNKQQQQPNGAKQAPSESNDDYENSEELSTTVPPKKHKHKKTKSKTSDSTAKQLDPIELALEQQKQHPAAGSPVHEQYKMIHNNLAMEFRDHDGQSERPGGAVLSLTLGLLVTAALAILVGCRMRTVGRRSRRLGGKTPYAHEADFLVNGMYL